MLRTLSIASLLSLACLAGSVGCAPGSSVGEQEDAAEDESELSVSFQKLNVRKSNSPEGLTVITRKADYVAFFGEQPPAGVNFNQSWVIHYSLGVKNTGGFGADILSVDRNGPAAARTLDILVQDTSPGPNCIVTQALTNPQVTIKIPKQKTSIDVNHTFASVTTDCGTEQNWCAAALCGPDSRCDEFTDSCVQDLFCPRVRCANGYECSEELDQCIGRICDPEDSNSCPSGFSCENQIACITQPCPTEFRCEPAREVTCEEIGWTGICQGPTLKYCDGDEMTTVECAPGQCEFVDAEGYYDCVP